MSFINDGPQKAVHIARVNRANGGAQLSLDIINAFGEIGRQAVLDASHQRWPEQDRVFAAYYGAPAMVVFIVYELNGDITAYVNWSVQGTRQGCVLGSIGFCLTTQTIYETLAAEFPSFLIRAITDDMPTAIPPPPDPTNEAWQALYRTTPACLLRWDSTGNPPRGNFSSRPLPQCQTHQNCVAYLTRRTTASC